MNNSCTETKPVRPRLSERVKTGLLQTIAYAEGKAEARVTTATVPDPPPAYNAEHIRTLRTGLGFSQPYFSKVLNVSPKTVQSWEQGTRTPSQASARLLQLIEHPHLLDALRQRQETRQEAAAREP